MKQFYFIIIFFCISITGNAQLLKSKQLISVSAGYGNVSGKSDNLFFPSSAEQSGLNFNMDYNHKILSWFSAGVSIFYNKFSAFDMMPEFATVESQNESLFSLGPNLLIHTPFEKVGWRNAIQIGFGFSPNMHFYSGSRIMTVENDIISLEDGSRIEPVIEMNNKSAGFGLNLRPEVCYRITQRFGLKATYIMQFLNIDTGYGRENIIESSYLGGLVFYFGNSKQLF